MAHQTEGATGEEAGTEPGWWAPWFRLQKLQSIRSCPPAALCGDKSAVTFAPGSALCRPCQAEQKGEAELPWVTRKWRVKGEEESLPRDGNRARELFIFSSDLECLSEDAQTRSCVSEGFLGGEITVLG